MKGSVGKFDFYGILLQCLSNEAMTLKINNYEYI